MNDSTLSCATLSWYRTEGDFMKYEDGAIRGPPTPRSRPILAQRTPYDSCCFGSVQCRWPKTPVDRPLAHSPSRHTMRRSDAQRASSWRFESWSLRRTELTCVSTVLTEMLSLVAICL